MRGTVHNDLDNRLNERLATRGFRFTPQREQVYAVLLRKRDHPTAEQVFIRAKRDMPEMAQMVRDPEIERLAVQEAIRHEEARGWQVESVESENRGFDLISRKPHPEDPKTFIEVRFIEVKGRADVGDVFLSSNEYRTAERLAADYWLYVVYNCGTKPEVHPIQDPARLDWAPLVKVEHYRVEASVLQENFEC